MNSTSASQRYIAVALLAASLAGVYALGRSQADTDVSAIPLSGSQASSLSALPSARAQAAEPAAEQAAEPAAAKLVKSDAAEAAQKPAPSSHSAKSPPALRDGGKNEMAKAKPGATGTTAAPSKPVLCNECATVLSVRQEQRAGEASGLGAVGGAVIGGLLGSQIGGGNGKKLATVGGAAAGGYFGNEMEKKHKAHSVWKVRVAFSDQSTRSFEYDHEPDFRVDETVRLRDGQLTRP